MSYNEDDEVVSSFKVDAEDIDEPLEIPLEEEKEINDFGLDEEEPERDS